MNIVNGIVQDKFIQGIPLKLHIVEPYGKNNVRTLRPMIPLGITVHNTANESPTAGDEQHGKYLENVEKADVLNVSWHFTVDWDSITQHLPLNEQGNHASDGSGPGNATTIAIEIAENKNYAQAEANAIKLKIELMKHFNFKIEVVRPHRYYATKTKKLCPRKILKSELTWQKDWKVFQDKVMKEFKVEEVVEVKEDKLSDWANEASKWFIDSKIIQGNGKGFYGWQEPITLERLLVILYRLLKHFKKI